MKPTQNPRHLAPDDPRHGTQAGYVAGCRCEPCRVGRYRAQKESRLYALQNNGTCRAPTDQVSALIQQWIGQGIGVNAVARAAGLNNNTLRTTTVSRWTIDALERLSEDDFPPFTRVYADLTRKRVYSLMAAGHQMVDMPIRRTGTWRTTEKCTARMARDIREHYLSHEMTMGDCATTASRARNAGHEIPAAWDDPGTLAWPENQPPCTDDETHELFDEVKVQRVLDGRSEPCNRAERLAIMDRWPDSLAALERLTGWNLNRLNQQRKAVA